MLGIGGTALKLTMCCVAVYHTCAALLFSFKVVKRRIWTEVGVKYEIAFPLGTCLAATLTTFRFDFDNGLENDIDIPVWSKLLRQKIVSANEKALTALHRNYQLPDTIILRVKSMIWREENITEHHFIS